MECYNWLGQHLPQKFLLATLDRDITAFFLCQMSSYEYLFVSQEKKKIWKILITLFFGCFLRQEMVYIRDMICLPFLFIIIYTSYLIEINGS